MASRTRSHTRGTTSSSDTSSRNSEVTPPAEGQDSSTSGSNPDPDAGHASEDAASIRAAVMDVLADPTVIRQFAGALAAASSSATGESATVVDPSDPVGSSGATASGEGASGPSGTSDSAGKPSFPLTLSVPPLFFYCGASSAAGTDFTAILLSRSGTTPVGVMPSPSELGSLSLSVAQAESLPATTAAPTQAFSVPGTSIDPGVEASSFSLGQGFPLIPAKLVDKVQSWKYISMSELLPDNLELARRASESTSNSTSSSCSRSARRRELGHDLNGLLAWSVCFTTYSAIVGQKHPKKMKELLAYQATVIIEALRFNGRGWLPYDKMFREHIAKHPDTDWSIINPMFYSLSYLSQKIEARTCTKCMGPDHSQQECALSSLEQSPLPTPPQTPPYSRSQDVNRSRAPLPNKSSAPPRKRLKREGTPTPSTGAEANSFCFSWNEGQCARFPKECPRRHQCIRCRGDHQLVVCTATVTPKE